MTTENQTGTAPDDGVESSGIVHPHLRTGLASHVGRARSRNEDTVLQIFSAQKGDLSGLEFGLFIVADGMGGQSEGQRAADMAARIVAQAIVRQIYLPFLEDSAARADIPPLQEALLDALRRANSAVHAALPESGTTLTAALIIGNQAHVAHVGDSRAYLVYPDRVERLTHDHTLVERLVELGQLSAGEIALHPQRNVLYRAVGQGEGLEIDVSHHTLTPGARLLLCCDGLWGVVAEEQMVALIRGAPSPQDACERLVAAALEAGGPDNITALVVEMITGERVHGTGA